jgi:hypothetical protein
MLTVLRTFKSFLLPQISNVYKSRGSVRILLYALYLMQSQSYKIGTFTFSLPVGLKLF